MKTIFLAALEGETKGLNAFIITGVGKINATFKTLDVINKYNPKKIVNFGTAGSTKANIQGLVRCTNFIQRDMDVRGLLNFKLGETPFDSINKITFGKGGLTCGTGDSFVKSKVELDCEVVDMEAYAIAKVCKIKNIEFKCYKYISDYANSNSNNDWNNNVAKGVGLFLEKFPESIL